MFAKTNCTGNDNTITFFQLLSKGICEAVGNMAEINPLLSTQKTSDSELQVVLHPLVLLTISDYITRHTLRRLQGPVVGALLGQQNGREITIEHAFECLVKSQKDENGSEVVLLDDEWFNTRLQQSLWILPNKYIYIMY